MDFGFCDAFNSRCVGLLNTVFSKPIDGFFCAYSFVLAMSDSLDGHIPDTLNLYLFFLVFSWFEREMIHFHNMLEMG